MADLALIGIAHGRVDLHEEIDIDGSNVASKPMCGALRRVRGPHLGFPLDRAGRIAVARTSGWLWYAPTLTGKECSLPVEKLAMVLYPVDDLVAALAFYEGALGLPVKFRDGDRFCALDAGGATLALAAAEERVVDAPCAGLKVDDVDDVVAELVAAGARMERPAEDGPHERRAVLRDPDGNPLVIFGPLA